MRDRPLGVTILAVLMMLLGLWTLCGGLFSLAGFSLGFIGSLFGADPSIGAGFSALFSLIWGIVAILLGLGLWRLMRFAWSGTIVILAVRLVFFVYALIGPPGVDWIGTLITALLLIYLTRPGVKGRFVG
jgi:hypothetical protein